jgi:hypothetical protein
MYFCTLIIRIVCYFLPTFISLSIIIGSSILSIFYFCHFLFIILLLQAFECSCILPPTCIFFLISTVFIIVSLLYQFSKHCNFILLRPSFSFQFLFDLSFSLCFTLVIFSPPFKFFEHINFLLTCTSLSIFTESTILFTFNIFVLFSLLSTFSKQLDLFIHILVILLYTTK